MRAVGNEAKTATGRQHTRRRKGRTRMSEVDPLTPAEPPRRWWHDEHGPMDPLAAQYLAITWPRDNHDPRCAFFAGSFTPYDCACVRRAQAIVAASRLRHWRKGQWANPKAAT